MPGRPRAPKTPEEALGRALAKTLRHAAKSQGIPQDEKGWCNIDELLSHPPYSTQSISKEAVYDVVSKDKKGRYELSEDAQRIRAVQGHSIDVDVEQVLITLEDIPETIVHGTYFEAWKSIESTGLSRMGRQHIHFATGLPKNKGVISGMRNTSEVLIYIDGKKAIADGISLLKAKNGAILSPGIDGIIPTKYFLRVEDRQGNVLYEAT